MLETVCRAAAPLLPLTTEAVWRGLTGEPSVHLADWPDVSGLAVRPRSWPAPWTWSATCAAPRSACARRTSCGCGCRWRRWRSRTRTPSRWPPFTELIADEVNVKAVELADDPASLGTFELAVNPRLLGPRLGGQVQEVIRAVKAGDWTRAGERVVARPASSSSPASTS